MTAKQDFQKSLHSVIEPLRVETRASRTTIRIDVPDLGLHVNLPAAESKLPDVKSLLQEGSLDQRAAPTVAWLEKERKILVQEEFGSDPTAPPKELIEIYGTHAQMLGPLEQDGNLVGWISVHSNVAPRHWTSDDVDALQRALDAVQEILQVASSP
jgi:maleate isomerase